jgi:hypothetical protein
MPSGPAAGLWPFAAFGAWRAHGHGYGRGHGHGHGHGYGHGAGRGRGDHPGGGFGLGPGLGLGADGRRGERLQARISAFLDLSERQQAALGQVLDQFRARRRALRGVMSGPEVARLVENDSFAREAAQQLLDTEIDALRAGVPALVQAVGDFFDALDFDQQQALRFMMRRLRRRAGRHDAATGPF